MHELSVCQGMLSQVLAVAEEHGAHAVTRVTLRVGPLSGVEPRLLEQAFPVASAGTLASGAELVIEEEPITVQCRRCGAVTAANIQRLVCGACGDWRTQLTGGDELLLASVALERDEANHV